MSKVAALYIDRRGPYPKLRGRMRLLLLALACCSSRPELAVPPPDAGAECRDCWESCGETTSRKAASFCAWQCNVICESEMNESAR